MIHLMYFDYSDDVFSDDIHSDDVHSDDLHSDDIHSNDFSDTIGILYIHMISSDCIQSVLELRVICVIVLYK